MAPAAALAILAALPLRAVDWDPVAPAELSGSAPTVDPDAAVEVVFRRIAIDDSDFPAQRRIHEYVRYKVFDPEKAANLTRVSQISYSFDGFDRFTDVVIAARLTNPDGSTRTFGRKDVQQKSLRKESGGLAWADKLFGTSGEETTESVLAVSGLAKGAILDIQTGRTELAPAQTYSAVLQLEDVPERKLELSYRQSGNHDWYLHEFALNGPAYHAAIKHDDNGGTMTVAAENVPPLYREAFSGPSASYALTFLADYKPVSASVRTKNVNVGTIDVDYKTNPWGGYATQLYILDQDRTLPTKRVTALAAQLTAGAAGDHDKAVAVHRYVQDLYHRFLHQPATNRVYSVNEFPWSLDQVLDFPKNSNIYFSAVDFTFLETALFRAAGWEASLVALPDVALYPFNQRMVAQVFLPLLGVRVHVGPDWAYAYPADLVPLAFGALPWEAEQGVALAEGRGTQQFLPVPGAPASASGVLSEGAFALDADGNLTGTASSRYLGHLGTIMRVHLNGLDEERQRAYFHQALADEFKPAQVKVERITGQDDGEAALTVEYSVDWPDYATRTQDRLIFHPSAFRVNMQSPFPEATRHYGFLFPYAWNEQDHVIWTLPAGFQFESPKVPPSVPGDVLSYKVSMAREMPSGRIHYRREFSSSVTRAKADAIGAFKAWYDGVVARDQFELVLRRTAPAPKADAEAAP